MLVQDAETLADSARVFYHHAPHVLQAADVPYLLGGAYALAHYTGVTRHTKDLDLFLRPADVGRALAALESAGYRTELTYDHWLAKAFADGHFIDLIFNLGNGVGPVEDAWFVTAEDGLLFGAPVKVIGPEDLIFSKMFTLDRGRYDGADIAHVIRACSARLDWRRLLDRCGRHGRVLLSHLVLFGYVYPSERDRVPAWVIRELTDNLLTETVPDDPSAPLCRGTLVSPTQYQIDIEQWGYRDARLRPHGAMTADQVERWIDGVRAGK
jgi:hypothetical protein